PQRPGLTYLNALEYDEAGQIDSVAAFAPGNTTVYSYYLYDDLGRMTAAGLADGSFHQYRYDLNGNRTRKTTGSVITHYTYASGSNRLQTVQTGAALAQTVSTDATG